MKSTFYEFPLFNFHWIIIFILLQTFDTIFMEVNLTFWASVHSLLLYLFISDLAPAFVTDGVKDVERFKLMDHNVTLFAKDATVFVEQLMEISFLIFFKIVMHLLIHF